MCEKMAALTPRFPPISNPDASFSLKRTMTYFGLYFALIVLFCISPGCRKPDALLPAMEPPEEQVYDPGACIDPYKPPVFPGGEAALLRFLHERVKYSPRCSEYIGTSVISFEVQADGSVSDLKILKLGHPGLEPMIWEMFAQMPRWTPGEQNGEPIRTRMVCPIRLCSRER